jgi:hypothetical protein
MLEPGWPQRLPTAGGTVDQRLGRLCTLCTEGLDVTGASVQLVASAPHRLTVHATDPVAGRLDDLQQELGEGPAVDVLRTGGQVLEEYLDQAARWPWFAPAAVTLGAAAVFAWPVRVGATSLGILGLYRQRSGPLPREELADAVALADAAAIVLLDNPAIDSADALVWVIADHSRFRPEVHQATGMLTVQLGLGLLDAYARLCAAAYADGRSTAALSRDIVARRTRLGP